MDMLKLTLTVLLASLPLVHSQSAAPIVEIDGTRYQGIVNDTTGISSYLGIRYAASPVGELRWRAPRPPPRVAGVQIAGTAPPQCLQAQSGSSPTTPFPRSPLVGRAAQADTEDCLYLNVFFPGRTIPHKKLPVVFWIHGGGYTRGSALTFNGGDLIGEANNGVVVIIQYRLGIFGFLPGTKVKTNGDLNVGLLDQDFALRWVRRHVNKFGGDPERVTIWGQSAGIHGAGSVLQHVVARDGRTNPPLFRAAITSSSFLPSQYFFNDTIPETVFSDVASQVGCTEAEDTLDCLRRADTSALEDANNNIGSSGFFGTFTAVPVIDGEFITQRATQALRQRKVNGKMLLSVTNTHEGNNFVNQNTADTVNVLQYASSLFPKFDAEKSSTVARLYAGLGSAIDQVNAIMGEAIFICPTYYLLRAFPGRAFKAEFAVPPGLHAEDLPFYYPSSGTPAFNNTAFKTAFADIFLAFVTALDPNDKINRRSITPSWRKYDNLETEMLFNRTEDAQADIRATVTDKSLLLRCSFWESVSAITAQ